MSTPTLPAHSVYSDPSVVDHYLHATYLEDSERSIMQALSSSLSEMNMLDIAIGTGRTTEYFAPLVKTYTGVDYSEPMIKVCSARLTPKFPDATFAIADMRKLEIFSDHSFDFILISANAISAVLHLDRLQVFREIHRVCKPGGFFAFSAHNLQSVDSLFGLRSLFSGFSPLHPRESYWHFCSWYLRRAIYNPLTLYPRIKQENYAILNDGAHEGRLNHYYIKPEEQIKQLEPYFDNIGIFARNGEQFTTTKSTSELIDPWLYYLCNNRRP